MKTFNKIYLQVKDYDGSENSETTITWSPARVNDSDIEYINTEREQKWKELYEAMKELFLIYKKEIAIGGIEVTKLRQQISALEKELGLNKE